MGTGSSRGASGARRGAREAQCRSHRHGWNAGCQGAQGRDRNDTDCHGNHRRSGRCRSGGQSRAARRECHRVQHCCAGFKRETARIAQRNRSQRIPGGSNAQCQEPAIAIRTERDADRSPGVRVAASPDPSFTGRYFGASVRSNEQCLGPNVDHSDGSDIFQPEKVHRGSCRKAPAAGDVFFSRICKGGRSRELWSERP